MALIKMLPHFNRPDAQTMFDVFVQHAPSVHYASLYRAIYGYSRRSELPAVKLFMLWFESLKDDPRMFGALSVSDVSGAVGALTDTQVNDGQLSMMPEDEL